MSDGFVDPLDLKIEARARGKSARRLLSLCAQAVTLVRSAAPRPFALSVAIQLTSALLLAGQVYAVKLVLDGTLAASTEGAQAVIGPIVLLAILTSATAVTGALQQNVGRYLGELVARSMWGRVLDAANAVPLRSFESSAFYDRLQRVQANALSRPAQVASSTLTTLGALAATVTVAVTLIGIAPLLLPLMLLGGLPLMLTSRLTSRQEFDFSVRQTPNQRVRAYLTYIQTDRDAAKEIRAFDLAPMFGARFDRAYGEYLRALRTHLGRRSLLTFWGNFGSAIVLAATLALVILLIAQGSMGVSEAGAAIVAVRLLQTQVQAAVGGVQSIFESGLFLDDVDAFLQIGQAAGRELEGETAPPSFTSIRVDGASFTYPGSTAPALDNVSLTLEAGQIVAVVGENGSGKTTLAKLLAGLYDPDSGSVRWDGVDIRTFDRRGLRARIAVIFQDFTRYALSATENIAAGSPVDPQRVRDAARASGADRVIETLPEQYDTMLSRLFKSGRDLSGGQWQRVAIARAYYRDSPLVVLDEPTSALDPRAERELFASLRGVLEGRSAVIISHRFSTVRSADRIYVMGAGKVIESGQHEELMALGGLYAELFTLQAAGFTDAYPPS